MSSHSILKNFRNYEWFRFTVKGRLILEPLDMIFEDHAVMRMQPIQVSEQFEIWQQEYPGIMVDTVLTYNYPICEFNRLWIRPIDFDQQLLFILGSF
jgi:hypothetical protein